MELLELSENVEIVQTLGDYPNQENDLTPEQLKEKFDTGSRIIKRYLNDQVVPAFAAQKENVDKLVRGMEDGTFVGPQGPQGPQGPAGAGVGVETPEGGTLFNDYDTNEASAQFATAFGSETKASGVGSIAMGVGSEAQAEAAIAGGTTNDSHIKDIAGVDIGILTDSMIAEALGERGVRLRDNLSSNPASIAAGVSSVAYGTGTRSHTAMSAAFGAGTEAGSKGFYIHKVTVPANGGNITVSLSTEQKPYYKYTVLGATVERNKTATWGDAQAKQMLASLAAGDKVNIILKKVFCLCESIVSVNAENGTVTLSNTGGITKANVDEITVFESLVTAESTMLALLPYQFSFAVPAKPDVGIADLHFAAIATGLGSIAAGNLSQAHGSMNLAAAQSAFVIGKNNEAGYNSFASGENTKALGNVSHAEGYFARAVGDYSHAEGYFTRAVGDYSHAEGTNAEAIGNYSHAEGATTRAEGITSHAEGSGSVASGDGSHAEGKATTASGAYSHAEGQNTLASGSASHAGGYNTQATAAYQTAIGKYNATSDNALFIIGNGTSTSKRSNAFAVNNDGSIVLGSGCYGDTLPQNPVEGQLFFLKV